MMNHRERLLTALDHREPDRVPIDFAGTGVSSICFQAYDDLREALGLEPRPFDPDDLGAATWAGVVKPHEDVYQRMHSDVEMVGMGDPDAWTLEIKRGERYDVYVDEWGARLYRPKGGHYFDYREFPIQEGTVEAFKAWHDWPDPRDPGRWRGFRERCLDVRERGRAVTSFSVFGGGIFEQPARVMPMQEFLLGIAKDPEFSDIVLGTMFDIYYEATVCMLEQVGDILDVWVYWDDLSTQRGPMVSPTWYERHLMPLHRRLFDKVKSMSDAKIFFHTCGAVRRWIPSLIDVGVDILNPVQISAEDMDPFELNEEFGDDIVFWGGACDPQHTLAFGTPDEVREDVRRNIDGLGPGGGFVFANVHNIQNQVPPENIIAMFDTCYEYGVYD